MANLVERLAVATGLDKYSVIRIMNTAPVRYKVYHIAKKSGGLRRIAHPAREVKALQRAFNQLVLADLPVHSCATAYKSGSSIKVNADAHRRSGPILKMDFKDFFPSIKKGDWENYCRKTGCIDNDEDISLSASLLFHHQPGYASLRLAIGAPSSPMLSNILMYDFDDSIVNSLMGSRIIYTRYADDLTFSAPRTGYLHDVNKIVRQAIGSVRYPKLKLNNDKTNLVTKKYKRVITGLVISNDGRSTIGWRKKRQLHSAVHRAKFGKLEPLEMQKLAGVLAFVNSIEPCFVQLLRDKYGPDVIDTVNKCIAIPRGKSSR